jgi:carbon-monoxide dehydrogenase medium subunit
MKPASFEYHVPDSIEQALDHLHEYGSEAKLLAGGQSLIPAMNFRVVQPGILIDLNRIKGLEFVHEDGKALRLGAMTRERELEMNPLISQNAPLLSEAVPHIAHPQIRNRGTLGGSLAHADPAAELPVLMVALDARLRARSLSSERWIAARDFFSGMFATNLKEDEMLVEVELPSMPPRTGWSFMEVAPRAGDYALMGVAALVTLDERGNCKQAKLVYLNAGDGPVDAMESAELLQGGKVDDKLIESAAALAGEKEINPYGNVHTSADFQRHLARVLTMRAVKQAFQRAGELK